MNPLMLLPSLMKIGDKFIEDKDKKAEFASKLADTMLNTQTYKWVDALVKLSYASEQIIKGLVRPLFSVGIFIYGIANPEILTTLHNLGTVGDMGIATIFGAAPAWGISRYKEKQKKADMPEEFY